MELKDWFELEDKIKAVQNKERFHHTIGVMNTACALAMNYGMDVQRARMAGLLHDCAKSIVPNSEKAALCDKYGVKYTKFEAENPHLLHGKLGAYLAKNQYGVDDEEICSAISFHTTGKPDMTGLEQIVFIADYIEPDRDYDDIPRLAEVRKMAFNDLDECTFMILKDTLEYLKEAKRPIDTTANEAYEYYAKKLNKGE